MATAGENPINFKPFARLEGHLLAVLEPPDVQFVPRVVLVVLSDQFRLTFCPIDFLFATNPRVTQLGLRMH